MRTKTLEFADFFGDRRNFGGSDKGKISRIETKYDPFTKIIRKIHINKFTLMIGRSCKIRGLLSKFDHSTFLLYWCVICGL
ncbi:Uncharacterized protein dnm_067840 [Desulfonema magnum]|uniref:Uncharacterized protein n=1 Tax=Desulfonema magnum TaxID=45655 RepID=A0A975BSU3_9BACT|nr:Uncharacterized protein dnm_067840 [Desulfonema magnum]